MRRWTALGCAALLSACAAARAEPSSTYALTLTRGSRLLVDARINGHAVRALLDSAAESTFVDRALAQRLKLGAGAAVLAQGSGKGAMQVDQVPGVELQVFGIHLLDQTIAVADLSDIGRRLEHRRVDAILGREIFDAARLQIDIAQRRITVLPADSQPPGVQLPLLTQRGIETLPVRVEGVGPLQAAFDLGNGSQVLLSSALAARMKLLSDGRAIGVAAGGGLGGALQRQTLILSSLEVAGQRFTAVPAAIDVHDSATDVNIGMAILKDFLITADYARHLLWLKPQGAVPAPNAAPR
jgi:predicted aspartyl protease